MDSNLTWNSLGTRAELYGADLTERVCNALERASLPGEALRLDVAESPAELVRSIRKRLEV